MNGEKAIGGESGGSTTLLPRSVGILLVDGDSICLTIISKMLRRFGYKVMTAKRATDALCIIRESKNEVKVVLSEAYLPDMNKYELLERVGEMSKLPVVIMSADGDENDMLGGLFKGAAFYLVKPITVHNIKNLWQFAFMKKMDPVLAAEGLSGNSLDEDMEDKIIQSEIEQSRRNTKRKELKDTDNIEEDENDDSAVLKKPKLVWTDELHNKFLQAVRVLGIDGAHPKKILQHMNVPGLKKENISSHLQKYRLSLKREQDAKEMTMNRNYCRLPSAVNILGGSMQFPQMPSVMRSFQPELGSCDQKNLNSSSMFMPTLDPAYFLNHAGPSGIDTSNFKNEQLKTPSIGFTHPGSYNEGIGTTSREKLAGLHQTLDSNGEGFLNEKMAFSSCGDSGFASAPQWPTSLTKQKDEGFLSGNMTFSSSGDTGFGSATQWQQQQLQQPRPEQEKLQQPPPAQEQLQQPAAAQEQLQQEQQLVWPQLDQNHGIFGSERAEADGLFEMENLLGLFLDEDFDDLW